MAIQHTDKWILTESHLAPNTYEVGVPTNSGYTHVADVPNKEQAQLICDAGISPLFLNRRYTLGVYGYLVNKLRVYLLQACLLRVTGVCGYVYYYIRLRRYAPRAYAPHLGCMHNTKSNN